MTYGSGAAVKPGAPLPDLIAAYGTNGIRGYVRSSDLEGPSPQTPQEAMAQQAQTEASHGRTIALYAQDGKTVIGGFFVEPPKGP